MESSESFSRFISKYRTDNFLHAPSDAHKKVLHAYLNGDRVFFESLDFNQLIKTRVGKLSNDPVKQVQSLIIANCAIASHMAILSDVNSELALSLSDYYIQMSQKTSDLKTLTEILRNSSIHFSDIISKHHSIPYSKTACRAIQFINNNIYSTIYVNDIATSLGMNPTYISKHFKDETGINLKTYIHLEKIKEAKNLMLFTDMTITEISVNLGYSDLSHFIHVFKKYEGCPPTQLILKNRAL